MFKNSLLSFFTAALLVLTVSTAAIAQSNSFSDISKIQLRNSNPIMEDGKVRGYYFFYRVEKKDRKTAVYKIQFVNENLETTGSKTITGSNSMSLTAASYNGTNVMLKFFDLRERVYTYRQYDRTGELVSKKTKPWERTDAAAQNAYNAYGIDEIYPAGNQGFLNLGAKKFKKIGYEINFFPNTKETRGWSYNSPEDDKLNHYARIIGTNDDIILLSVESIKGVTMQNLVNTIIGIDTKTGKKIFEKPLSKEDLNVIVANSFIDDAAKQFTVFGTYFGESGDAYQKNGKGLYSISFDYEGNVLKEKVNYWEKDFGKLLPVDKKGKMADLGFFYLHDVFKTADGRIFAFGEQYRKAISGGGVALQMLGANVSAVKVVVEDMLFFEFDDNFDLKTVEFFDKHKSNVALPEGYGAVKAFKLGIILDRFDEFDYFYKTENKEKNSASVIYRDWNRAERQSEIHSVTYINGEFVKDMIPLETKGSSYRVMRGKEGHIVITEYFKKEKKLNVRMEKFNF